GAVCWAVIEQKRIEALVPAHGFTTIFYLVAKQHGRERARRAVADLLSVFGVAPVDHAVIVRAMALGLADFEDAVAAAAGEAAGCDVIVSRDPQGFRGGPLDAIDPALALAALADEIQEPGGRYQAQAPPQRRRRR